MYTNESSSVCFNRKGNTYTLTLSPDVFDFFNTGASEVHGRSLVELAIDNPTGAYQYLRSAVGNHALQSGLDISADGMIIADSSLEELEVVRELASYKMLDSMPMEYEGPFGVTVGIYPDAEEIELGIVSAGETIEVMSLQVEPPALAA